MLSKVKIKSFSKHLEDVDLDGPLYREDSEDQLDLMEPMATSIILEENGNKVSVKELYKVLKEDL